MLTNEMKLDLALALLLWRDYISNGQWDSDVSLKMLQMANTIGIMKELDSLFSKVPPMKIEPRD